MKKILLTLAVLLIATSFVFAGGSKETTDSNVITVGATPEPHAAMLNLIAEDVAAMGYTLKVIEFTDYVTPNEALESGQLDANFFQHIPYMESFNIEKGYNLVNAGGIHIEPVALYSEKYTDYSKLPSGATIAIPNDPTNEGRALLLIQAAGLIRLDPNAGTTATPLDITGNPKKFKFKEIEAASLTRVLQDVDAAVINGNYALLAGLSATRDGLIIEGEESPYVNIIAVKNGNENSEKIKALVKALQSEKIAAYIEETYPNGEVVIAF